MREKIALVTLFAILTGASAFSLYFIVKANGTQAYREGAKDGYLSCKQEDRGVQTEMYLAESPHISH